MKNNSYDESFDDKLNHVGNIKEKRNSDEITFDIFKNKKSFNIRK